MTSSPFRIVYLIYPLAFALLMALALMTALRAGTLVALTEGASQNQRVLMALHKIKDRLLEAETEQRGFLITGDEKYLEPYRTAVNQLDADLQALRELAPDSSERVDDLARLVQAKRYELNDVIIKYQRLGGSDGFAAARAAALEGDGKRTMTEFRRLIDEWQKQQYEELLNRERESIAAAEGFLIFDVGGNVVVLLMMASAGLLVHQEVKRRQTAEASHRAMRSELEDVFNSAMDAIIVLSDKYEVEQFNAAGERLFGCPARVAMGRPIASFIPNNIGPPALNHIKEFDLSGESRRVIGTDRGIKARRVNGSEFSAEASISRATIDGRKRFTVIVRDISERLRQQTTLRWQANLIDQTRDAIFVRDPEGRFTFWSRGAQALLGWTADEVLSRPGADIIPALKMPAGLSAWHSVHKEGAWSGDFRLSARDGREIIMDSRWTQIRGQNGGTEGVLTVATDVTEQRQLHKQLMRSQRLESIGSLASGVAHDLNNLLTPVMMTVSLLREDHPAEKRAHYLNLLQASAERGADLVRQLVTFAGGATGDFASLDLASVVQHVLGLIEHSFSKSIRIISEIPDTAWPIRGNETQLTQVLMNLCVNARDAMADGGTLRIEARNFTINGDAPRHHASITPGPYVRITVADTGTGIPADIIDKVFDPFFTTKPKGRGTGLGLSLAAGIVRGHGGLMNVYSEPGKGTKFAIYLPAQLTPTEKRQVTKPLTVRRGAGELILLVDDEAGIQQSVGTKLESQGYHVIVAPGGREGVELYRARHDEIRAVILDMNMPGHAGPATFEDIRALNPKARVIASSGLSDSEEVASVLAAGAVGFLQKPYTDDQLFAALARALNDPESIL